MLLTSEKTTTKYHTSPQALDWNGCLAKEVGFTKHIFVLHDEAHQSYFRIQDIKLTELSPDWIESVVH